MCWFGFFGLIGFVFGGGGDGKKEGISTAHVGGEELQEMGYKEKVQLYKEKVTRGQQA